jgi:hypothetical protein
MERFLPGEDGFKKNYMMPLGPQAYPIKIFSVKADRFLGVEPVEKEAGFLTCGGEGGGAGSPHRSRWG